MADKSDRLIRVFNGPRRLEKAMHMLEGIVRGVTLDRRLNDDELIVLSELIGENSEFRNKHPFTEVVPRLEQIINGSIFDQEGIENGDILLLLISTMSPFAFSTNWPTVTSRAARVAGPCFVL